MKLNLKLSKRPMMIAAVAVLAMGAVMVSRSSHDDSAGSLDDAANRACSDFAAGYPQARTKTARLALADRVTASSGRTGNRQISQRAVDVGRTADDGSTAWRDSAEALTTACRAAGWQAA
ncbi:hypothetical protein HH310_20040 [Actinoplanes sp. TBRC 11911]|uniref:hypothetical protein n=1 Tax=Actinoplanes sp. TBRC 11911 TaxID=2729386 RepID=UPI00145CD5EE|nr:hypothetical protein [Actinoplanes sp. TBRC 11911]NMO53465.1 hypothetical protein [Actinoplanes sp. TBRC 11911]